MDDKGYDVKHIQALKQNLERRLVTPSNPYPSGVEINLERRQEILQWAAEKKGIIIENDYKNEIPNHKNSSPTIFSLDT